MSYFDSRGEINASSVKEAFALISKFASALENSPSNTGVTSNNVPDADRDSLVAQAMSTQEGKLALAQAMANPIRKNLDYQGIARRALCVDPLPQGAIASYERDIDVAAYVISSNGSGAESRIFGDRVVVPEFEIYSNPTVRIKEVKQRRFNVIDRAVQKARQEIMAQEDANIFSALDAASSDQNVVQDIADAGLLKRDLAAIKKQIDGWDLVTTKYFMNINEFNDILLWGSGGGQGVGGGEIDIVTQREILQTGLFAHLWGADILVSKIVPVGTVYGAADCEFLGVMPLRQEAEVLPADEPRELKLGWVVSEIIGIGILNSRACAAGKKSTIVGA
jgi:hypothetical protein